MGNLFSDMIGIESAAEDFSSALKEAGTNATMALREVALTALNYITSFTPIISLLIVFLILLLLVSILSILGKILKDLEVSKAVRALVLIVVSVLLYTWFVAIQVLAALKLKTPTVIVIAAVSGVGLLVIASFCLLFIYRIFTGKVPNPFRTKDPNTNQPTDNNSTAKPVRKSRNTISPEPN